jgi:hypothetical protein
VVCVKADGAEGDSTAQEQSGLVRRRKAAKPASATTENGLHVTGYAGRQKRHDVYKTFDPSKQQGFLSVYVGQAHLGYLLPCGKDFEAYDSGAGYLGTFPSLRSAADAVSEAAI